MRITNLTSLLLVWVVLSSKGTSATQVANSLASIKSSSDESHLLNRARSLLCLLWPPGLVYQLPSIVCCRKCDRIWRRRASRSHWKHTTNVTLPKWNSKGYHLLPFSPSITLLSQEHSKQDFPTGIIKILKMILKRFEIERIIQEETSDFIWLLFTVSTNKSF